MSDQLVQSVDIKREYELFAEPSLTKSRDFLTSRRRQGFDHHTEANDVPVRFRHSRSVPRVAIGALRAESGKFVDDVMIQNARTCD